MLWQKEAMFSLQETKLGCKICKNGMWSSSYSTGNVQSDSMEADNIFLPAQGSKGTDTVDS